MDRELKYPERKSGYAGDEEPSFPQPGPPIRRDGQPAGENRGKRAPQEGSGVVIGSGASSGGAGNEEDYDSDAAGGGASSRPRTAF